MIWLGKRATGEGGVPAKMETGRGGRREDGSEKGGTNCSAIN